MPPGAMSVMSAACAASGFQATREMTADESRCFMVFLLYLSDVVAFSCGLDFRGVAASRPIMILLNAGTAALGATVGCSARRCWRGPAHGRAIAAAVRRA